MIYKTYISSLYLYTIYTLTIYIICIIYKEVYSVINIFTITVDQANRTKKNSEELSKCYSKCSFILFFRCNIDKVKKKCSF